MRGLRIGIVGAGIGGLTACLGLQRQGFDVTVFERARELSSIGAGILVTPNSFRALDHLGVGETVRNEASSESFSYYCRYDTAEVLLTTDAQEVIERYGHGILQVHRADLQSALERAVREIDPLAINLSHEFQGLTELDDGVSATFRNGVQYKFDALIGADGNASNVRSLLFQDEPPKFTGQVAFRAMIPADLVPRNLAGRDKVMYFAPQRMLLHYPLRRGAVMNLIGIGKSPQWEAEGWAIPATNNEFFEQYSDFNPLVLDLINAIPQGALSKWGLRDREPATAWVKGRVALIGDAAHPFTPFLGQGANIAMEDGFVIARCFASSDSVSQAMARYQNARKERGTSVQLMSREQGEALQGGGTAASSPGLPSFNRGLFEYDPVNVPI